MTSVNSSSSFVGFNSEAQCASTICTPQEVALQTVLPSSGVVVIVSEDAKAAVAASQRVDSVNGRSAIFLAKDPQTSSGQLSQSDQSALDEMRNELFS